MRFIDTKFLHWIIQIILKLFCLKLGPYSFTKFISCNCNDLWLAPFLQVKISIVNSAGGSSCCNYATDTFYSNYAGAIVCCNFMQVLKFYCNYVSGTFLCNYVGGSFCCIYAGKSFCSKYVSDNFFWNCTLGSLFCNYAGGIFCSALCTWLFLLQLCRWLFLL